MKKAFLLLSLFLVVAVACDVSVTVVPSANPSPAPTNTVIPPTVTPEIFMALTHAVPSQVRLSEVTLAVQDAHFGGCELVNCPPAPAGTRYLRVTLQALNLPADQWLDYKNLPEGIAIHDNTGASTPYNRLYQYAPSTQQLTLYFAVPESAAAFGLQWPGSVEIPLAIAPQELATAQPPSVAAEMVTVDLLTIALLPELAGGAHGTQIPRADGQDLPAWGRTPGHMVLTLEAYRLLGKSHEPQIYVYPALAYAELVPGAFESIHRLDNILFPVGGPNLDNPLPAIPFLNDQQVFASNIKLLSFQNGQGVRFVTEYAQHAASANNQDLFYHFQGLTRGGEYYVVAILPISHPMLAETSDAGAPLPLNGVPYPYMADPSADMQLYYKSVTDILNTTSAGMFTPTLDQLDFLIQSMRIGP